MTYLYTHCDYIAPPPPHHPPHYPPHHPPPHFQSRSNIAAATASEALRKGSGCLGAGVLMKLLANYCRNQNIKTAIRVGIVGWCSVVVYGLFEGVSVCN